MRYNVQLSDIQHFYSNSYLNNSITDSFSIKRDEINMGLLKMDITEWKTSKLSAHLIQSKADRDIQIIGGIPDEMAVIHFVCKGETLVNKGSSYRIEMAPNTNNLFFKRGEKNNHLFRENQENKYFRIFLPNDYIHTMTPQYPEIFGTIAQLIEKQCPLLKNNNLATSMEMSHVIDQIANCQVMGNLAYLYFEAKIHELLVLQIQQINKQDHLNCKCYIHYRKQINEARNIIEEQFKKPPTIKELAQMVNMSETVLKTSFKLFFGTTIYGYIFNYRMGIAKKLLINSSFTITEIAEHSGYVYSSHFTTAFRRKFGISPVEYRAKCA